MSKAKIRIFRDKSLYAQEKFDTRIYFKYYEQNSEGFYGIDVNGKIINVKNTQYADLVTTDDNGNWVIPLHTKRNIALSYYEGKPEDPCHYFIDGVRYDYDGPLINIDGELYAEIPYSYQVKRTFIADDGTGYSLTQMKNHYDIKGGRLYYSSSYQNKYSVVADFDENDPDATRYYYVDSLGMTHYIDRELESTKIYKVSEYINGELTEVSKPVYEENGKWYYLSGNKMYLTNDEATNIEYMRIDEILVYKEITNIKYEIEVNEGIPEFIECDALNEYMKTYSLYDIVTLDTIIFKTALYGAYRYKAYKKVEAVGPYWYYTDTNGHTVIINENPDNVKTIEIDSVSSIQVARYPAIISRYVYTDDNNVEHIYLGDTSLLTIDGDTIYADVYYDNINNPATYYIERVYNGITKRYYIFLSE